MRIFAGAALLALSVPGVAAESVSTSEGPQALSVTIYRAPGRSVGPINLRYLQGFALISETRTVTIPEGEGLLRFEGVAESLQPESVIISGLPGSMIEKNQDSRLLNPARLIDAALGETVTLVRTGKATGQTRRLSATIRSGATDGVVFQTPEGVEALRCIGLPETFTFERIPEGLSAKPVLSVRTRSEHALTTTVTLSYLARQFDWTAAYVARIRPDGKSFDLSSWVTLANGNGTSFPDARTQVVAGRLNREDRGDDRTSPANERIIAHCWPIGSTSHVPYEQYDSRGLRVYPPAAVAMALPMDVVVTAQRRVSQEDLGDLKLYRISEPTNVASRQSKQVLFLDQKAVFFTRLYTADLEADSVQPSRPARIILRTKNEKAKNLGMPLPAGQIAVFETVNDRPMLAGEGHLRDLAIGEEVEVAVGGSPDVHVEQTKLSDRDRYEVRITNARAQPVRFELRLQVPDGHKLTSTNGRMAMKDGRPIWRLSIPANGSAVLPYAFRD